MGGTMRKSSRTVQAGTKAVKGGPDAVSSRAVSRRRHSGLLMVERRDGFLLACPFILGVLFFWAGPMLYSIYLVTRQWNVLTPPKPIGLGNLQRLFADPLRPLSDTSGESDKHHLPTSRWRDELDHLQYRRSFRARWILSFDRLRVERRCTWKS